MDDSMGRVGMYTMADVGMELEIVLVVIALMTIVGKVFYTFIFQRRSRLLDR